MKITEEHLEKSSIEWFQEIGWEYARGCDIAPDAKTPKRKDYRDVVLIENLQEALLKINPNIPQDKIEETITRLIRPESPTLEVNNRQFHRFVNDGVPIDLITDDYVRGDFVRIIDFENVENNNFLIVNQFTVTGNNGNRRLDIVAFINGLPIAVLELKNPVDEDVGIWQAYEQIGTYKQELPDLFAYNLACIISDGGNARIGSITASKERYGFWRTLKDENDKPNFELQLETLVKGFFDKPLLLDYLRYFVIFEDSGKIIKKIAGYHQFHAVRAAVARTLTATNERKDGKCGVIWHTQGSGKSISMCCYTAKLMTHPQMNNPTIVVVTDRNDLDGQLYQTFCNSQELLKEEPKQATSREQLRELLTRPSGGIIFTTIQKFSLMDDERHFPTLSDRHNVVVISDEAHRSQYGLSAKVRTKDGKITYGYAGYLRDALPNAGFIGFTGTPISKEDRDTVVVFGNYISIYDIQQSQEDHATVPIYYDSRLADLELQVQEADLDEQVDEIIESAQSDSDAYANRQKRKWTTLEKLVTAETRVKKIARNLVEHFDDRLKDIEGKGMIVCISRQACVQMYNEIIALRPEWAGTLDKNQRPSINDGAIRVVMTGSASDRKELREHVYDKNAKKTLEQRYKKPCDSLKLVIVRDMWLTGFDVPPLHTMYLDKPMKGHNLMQAIARVNRIFNNKPGSLVVDYIGITSDLKKAFNTYTQANGRGSPTVDIEDALKSFLGEMAYARDMLRGVNYAGFTDSGKILELIADCCNHLLQNDEMPKKFCDTVLAAIKAHALCGTMPEAKEHREELAFFQAVKSALIKKEQAEQKISDEQIQNALKQIVSKALSSDEVVSISEIAGLKTQDISIMSEEFLEEVKHIKHKNIAVEMLKRLLRHEIKTKTATNLVLSEKYSALLNEALLRYKNRSIQSAQVIEELIQMAKDFRKDMEQGKELGLNDDEKAFYDALADNDSAVRELGHEVLKKIAHELTEKLRKSITIDWAQRESVRAGIRLRIRNLLKKYKYPPDGQDNATDLILRQAETLSEKWAD